MGNWTSVNIVGTCAEADVDALRKALDPGKNYENFHCLVCGGICGLANWARTSIDVAGNLAERDYGADDVREQLEKIAKVAPSLSVKVHVGGDYESDECVATVTLASGAAVVGPPQVKQIKKMGESEINARMLKAIFGKQ